MPRNVILAASFDSTPEKLYDMYLSAESHSAFTGMPVTIAADPGSPFKAFDGMLSGKMLHAEPRRMIVQTWRSANWPTETLDSILTLTFCRHGDGARIELVHINIPEEDFAGVSQGWEKFYWAPWREYLNE